MARAGLVLAWAATSTAAQQRESLDGAWQIGVPVTAAGLRYDKTVAVPGAFEAALGVGFDGVAWLRRTLPLRAEQSDARVRVEFAAAPTSTSPRRSSSISTWRTIRRRGGPAC